MRYFLIVITRFMLDAAMAILFLKMFYHFYRQKRDSMRRELRPWTINHKLFVFGVIFLVALHQARALIKSLFMQGFILDKDPNEFDSSDFRRGAIDQAVCTCTDFVLSVAILALLYFKNRETIKLVERTRSVKKQNMSSIIGHSAFSDGKEEIRQDEESQTVQTQQAYIKTALETQDGMDSKSHPSGSIQTLNPQPREFQTIKEKGPQWKKLDTHTTSNPNIPTAQKHDSVSSSINNNAPMAIPQQKTKTNRILEKAQGHPWDRNNFLLQTHCSIMAGVPEIIKHH